MSRLFFISFGFLAFTTAFADTPPTTIYFSPGACWVTEYGALSKPNRIYYIGKTNRLGDCIVTVSTKKHHLRGRCSLSGIKSYPGDRIACEVLPPEQAALGDMIVFLGDTEFRGTCAFICY